MALWIKALVWQSAVWVLSILLLFLPAGTLAWPPGWLFFALFFGFVGWLSIYLLRKNPSLLEERLTIIKSDQIRSDKVWLVAFYLLSASWLAVMSLDAKRFHWLLIPLWAVPIGIVFLLVSLCGIFLTIKENSYASPVLRLQADRGQTIVDTGVYRFVRHPLYTSACIFYVGGALLFSSGVGLLLAPIFVGMLMFRSVQEEHMLMEGLPGYNAYKTRVKYRFFPYVW